MNELNNLFNENAYLKENETNIKSIHQLEDKNYIVLKDNIFYPQGGGQKGDRGTFIYQDKIYHVINTIKHPEIKGALLQIDNESLDNFREEDFEQNKVICKLDWPFRYSQMRLHTLLHLFHCYLEDAIGKELVYPKVSSIKDDNTAFLQYESDDINEEIVNKATEMLLLSIRNGGEVITYPDENKEGYRWWEFNCYKIPCGGTHVKNINEIGEIDLTFSTKKGYKTISFKLKEVII